MKQIYFFDLDMETKSVIELRDIDKIELIEGHLYITNVDGLVFKTDGIKIEEIK